MQLHMYSILDLPSPGCATGLLEMEQDPRNQTGGLSFFSCIQAIMAMSKAYIANEESTIDVALRKTINIFFPRCHISGALIRNTNEKIAFWNANPCIMLDIS